MFKESYSIQTQIIENGKGVKGTLTLYSDRYEFNGMRKSINWEKAFCVKGTTKVKSSTFSSEKPHVVISEDQNHGPAFILETQQVNELVDKVAELGAMVRENRIAAETRKQTKSANKAVPTGVLYLPGEEPSEIRQRINRLCEKLDGAYPDKVIVGLHKDHKKWGETVTKLYRQLGYPDGNTFLNAYGYTTGSRASGRRSSVDPSMAIAGLKEKYPDGTNLSITELRQANPDIPWKTLSNKSNEYFGMTLSEYLVKAGILTSGRATNRSGLSDENQVEELIAALKKRYADKPHTGTLKSLREENPDIDWNAISRYNAQTDFSITLKNFLMKEGIMEKAKRTEEKVPAVIEKLKERYADKPYTGTLKSLREENPDIDWNAISRYNAQTDFSTTLKDFLAKQGIMEKVKSTEEKLADITETLKERYASGKQKADTIDELRRQNPDLQIKTIGDWSKKVYGKSAWDYLTEQGILSKDEAAITWQQCQEEMKAKKEAEKAAEERYRAELTAPLETTYYDPPVFYVEEIDVSGEEARDWEYKDDYYFHIGEIYIVDYLGGKDHIIIPSSINGKKVKALDSYAFKKCKASIVEIPGSFKNVAEGFGYRNENIETVIIGEGVESLGGGCFSSAKNITEVKVSRSVIYIQDSSSNSTPFENTPWFKSQKDLVMLGSVLARMNEDHAVLNVPVGVKTIGYLNIKWWGGLQKVVLPETVTTVCRGAFQSGKDIREFVFSDSLVNIEANAFDGTRWLNAFGKKPVIVNNQLYQYDTNESSVVIPEGVVKICENVFAGKTELKTIVLPKTLKVIDKRAFKGCENLTSVDLPEGLERIEEECFYGCRKLSKVDIPDSLIEIGSSAFQFCSALKEVILGQSVEVIKACAFEKCYMLRSVRMNNTVKRIEKNAFHECTSLDNIVIPNSVTKIEFGVFSDCKSLKSIKLHDGITEISDIAFSNCKISEISVPSEVGVKAFAGCNALAKVTFADGITEIKEACFSNCVSLKELIIPDSVKLIDESAFCGCTLLNNVVLPKTLKVIGKSAFEGCRSIEKIIIPDAVDLISDNAFKDCRQLSDVVMQGTVSNFGADVFTNAPYLEKEFDEFVVINGVLLKYRGSDKNVVIPECVASIGENAFAEASYVESIIIPDTVKTIGNRVMGALWGMSNPKTMLKKLVIGNGVTAVGREAFVNCNKLSEIVFGKALKIIGEEAFDGCTSIESIDLSETSVTEIKEGAFIGCYNVKNLKLPDTIEVIGRAAFNDVSLKSLLLPRSVRRVEEFSLGRTAELTVYDTIDPDSVEAAEWQYDCQEGTVNSQLACACSQYEYYITVLSSETEKIRYRIYYNGEERENYRAMMISAWGKNASFNFDDYDDYFMRTRSKKGRTEMAFCRIQYPEGLSAKHKANYEAFLERCMFIERSAKRTAEMIAHTDAVEKLQILAQYRAIDAHNIGWIREQLEAKKAIKCIRFLDETFSSKEG